MLLQNIGMCMKKLESLFIVTLLYMRIMRTVAISKIKQQMINKQLWKFFNTDVH
jgi:hypothetical protein